MEELLNMLTLLCVALYVTFHVECYGHVPTLQEYCNMKDFLAECPPNQVILMDVARYGRMRVGNCVQGNYGHIGCYIDVRPRLDQLCSGRHRCQFQVPDTQMYDRRSCPEDFMSYLEASYSCVSVAMGSVKQCRDRDNRRVKLLGPSGYIASVVTEEGAAGSVHCPWFIRVTEGQRINLTIYNFLIELPPLQDGNKIKQNSRRQENCFQLLEIKEQGNYREVALCPDDPRTKSVYLSNTNEVTVNVVDRRLLESVGTFLLKYEALGCPVLHPIDNAWTSVDSDGTVKVQCNFTEETWYLTCKGGTWVGHIGNCSHPQRWSLYLFGKGHSFPFGMLIVVGIGIILGIIIGGFLLTCVVFYTRRYRSQSPRKSSDVNENKPIIMSNPSHGTPTWSRQGLPPPPPPPPAPPLETLPTGVPFAIVGHPDMTSTHTLIRNPHAQDSGYGSASLTFSTFGPGNRQHIYESPNFT